MLSGNISWEIFIQGGSVAIEKNPTMMKKTTGIIPVVLNMKKIKGRDNKSPPWIKNDLLFILSEKYPAIIPPKPPIIL